MGGFFRYSTTRDWSVPHFEKMLEDNARLLSACMHAYQMTRHRLFHDSALGIVDYVESTLFDRTRGYFYGSQDADERYYGLARAQRLKQEAPFVDKVAYTSWNALMISAFLDAWLLLERPDLAQKALAVLRFLWQECWRPGEGMCHYWDGEAHMPGLLADQVWMAKALLDGYEHTGDWDLVRRTEEIVKWCNESLLAESGSYCDRAPGEALGLLKRPNTPIAENAVAAAVLTRLSRLTGIQEYEQWARSLLSAYVGTYPQYGLFAAPYALAVDGFLQEPLRVVVVGGTEDPVSLQLLRAAREPYAANRTVTLIDPVWESERLSSLGYPAHPTPMAYVCLAQTCAEPVDDSMRLVDVIQEMYQSRNRS
jgi:uncharacterized protein YyaL (SSP411 family)